GARGGHRGQRRGHAARPMAYRRKQRPHLRAPVRVGPRLRADPGEVHARGGDLRHRPPRRRGERAHRRQDRHGRACGRPVARLVHRLRALWRGRAQDRLFRIGGKWSVRRNGRRASRGGDRRRRGQAGTDSAMSLFSEIEKTIERGFRHWTERVFGPADSDQLLLVHRAILEEIETKIQTVARGRRVFPYPRVVVTLVAPDADRRALYQTAFGEGGRLENDVREALEGARCDIPRGFAVEVRTAEGGGAGGAGDSPAHPRPFEIAYETEPRAAAIEPPAPARLVVVRGKAEQAGYALERPRTNIGRMAELVDAGQRVMRRNDIVFEEGADEA